MGSLRPMCGSHGLVCGQLTHTARPGLPEPPAHCRRWDSCHQAVTWPWWRKQPGVAAAGVRRGQREAHGVAGLKPRRRSWNPNVSNETVSQVDQMIGARRPCGMGAKVESVVSGKQLEERYGDELRRIGYATAWHLSRGLRKRSPVVYATDSAVREWLREWGGIVTRQTVTSAALLEKEYGRGLRALTSLVSVSASV